MGACAGTAAGTSGGRDGLLLLHRAGHEAGEGGEGEEGQHRHAGHQAENAHTPGRDAEGARIADNLAGDLGAEIVVVRGAGDEETGADGDDEGGYLGN